MAQDKTKLPNNSGILADSGLSAKTVTNVIAYQHGSTMVIEVVFSSGSSFIKVRGMQLDVGGTNEWGTGSMRF